MHRFQACRLWQLAFRVAISVCGGLATLNAQAPGPFGLEMGLSKQQIEELTGGPLKPADDAAHEYHLFKMPRGLAEIESYRVRVLPKSGLCLISAAGVDVQTSSHGVELRREVDRMIGLLEASYGKSGRSDFLRTGSIWSEPEDWMTGLQKKERVLQAAWDAEEGSTRKNHVKQILLTASSFKSGVGYVSLLYRFENDDACQAELKSLASDVL